MNFCALTFIDASRMTASWVSRYRTQAKADHDWPLDRLMLRDRGKDQPILSEWKTARATLSMIRAAGAALLEGKPAMIDSAFVFAMKPNDRIEWGPPPDGPGIWAWMSLVPSPGAMLFSGIEQHNPPVGQLTAVSRGVPFSALNLGKFGPVWLVVDARAPE